MLICPKVRRFNEIKAIKYKFYLLFLQSVFVFYMKHKGSISQVYKLRDEVIIPQLFARAKQEATYPTTLKKLFEIAANLPLDSYYLADDTAVLYIRNRVFRGINKKHRSIYKQRLFESLYEHVCELRADSRYMSRGLEYIVTLALQRPSPCVGLSPNVIMQKYLELKKNEKV